MKVIRVSIARDTFAEATRVAIYTYTREHSSPLRGRGVCFQSVDHVCRGESIIQIDLQPVRHLVDTSPLGTRVT